jgi:phage-related minor tail protein
MPTPTEIDTAAAALVPPTTGVLSANGQADIIVYLRKYLKDTLQTSGYTDLQAKIAAATGRNAAQLQAVLNNIKAAGSKVAALSTTVKYSTQETINNELDFALMVLYHPIARVELGTQESNAAAVIRNAYACGCRALPHTCANRTLWNVDESILTRY